MPVSHLIAIDWGTSSLRAALFDAAGACLGETASNAGIMHTGGMSFPEIFRREFGPWLAAHPGSAVLASGMIGSRQGWREAPYVACPASFQDVAAGIAWLDDHGQRIGIVPGLVAGSGTAAPDVMRGEEIQIFGALATLAETGGTFILPGTHSKWARAEANRIVSFDTYMTGEVYGLLRQHSILGRLMPALTDGGAHDAFEPAAFEAGCRASGANSSGALLHQLFSVRTLGLFERFSAVQLPS
jgi:2-dehydro-3-deoxygalactonokinase